MSTQSGDQAETDRSRILVPFKEGSSTAASRALKKLIVPTLALFCVLSGFGFAVFGNPFLLIFALVLSLLALIGIWGLPDMRSAPTRTLEGLFFAFLAALVLWPNYLALALPGLPWITLTRLIGYPLLLTLLICISVSPEFRKEAFAPLAAAPILWRLVAVFAVLQAMSVVVSKDPAYSFQHVVANEVNWTAMFFVSAYVFLKPGRAERWAAMLCLTAVPILFISFWEHADNALPWAGHIPSFLKIEDESVIRILSGAHRDEGGYRVQSTFSTPLGLGEYIALTAPFVLHFMAERYHPAIRLAAAASIPLFIDVVLFADTRLGTLGCITAALLYLPFWAILRWRQRRRSLFGPAIVLGYPAIACVALASTLFVGRVREHIFGSGQYDDSTSARMSQYTDGIPMVLHHPWGYGAGMGAATLGYYSPAGLLTIDTYFLAEALDYGIFGFLVYYAMLLLGTFRSAATAIQNTTSNRDIAISLPVAISLFNFIEIKAVFSNEDNHPLAFMMLGMVVALACRVRANATGTAAEAPAAAGPVDRLLGFGGSIPTSPQTTSRRSFR